LIISSLNSFYLRERLVFLKWIGYSDYKAMKPYIDVADEIKIEAMKKFNRFVD